MTLIALLAIVAGLAVLGRPLLYGGEGANAVFNTLEHEGHVFQTPVVAVDTATASEVVSFMVPDSDIVILGAGALITTTDTADAGAAGSFKIGTKLGATTDDDAICGATTIPATAAGTVTGSEIAATLLTTIAPAISTANYLKYGAKPIVPAGTSVTVTHTRGASNVAFYKVQIRYRRIGKSA